MRSVSLSSCRDERGSAIVEFVLFGIAGLMPLTLLLSGVFMLQRSAFTAQSAVREATRAFVTAESDDVAFYAAQSAANMVFSDATLHPVPVVITCSTTPCLDPLGSVRIAVDFPVTLLGKQWRIRAQHEEKVDPWT